MRLLAALLIATLPAFSQLTLYTLAADGTETEVTASLLDLAAAHPGDISETRFRLRNLTADTIVLATLRVSGAGFSIENNPTMPYRVAPRTNVDFRVRFRPAGPGDYSAQFQVNDRALLLRAQGRDGVTVLGPDGAPLSAGQAHDFGRVEVGSSIEKRFVIRNSTTAVLVVTSVTVSGEAFSMAPGTAIPAKLDPGAEVPLTIRFAPLRSGIPAGLLTVDSRTFRLQGFAVMPELPDAVIDTGGSAAASAKQIPLFVRLAAPAPVDIAATVTLEFISAIDGYRDDPAIQFLPGASRTAAVTIPKGERAARWGRDNAAQAALQTGTTAGDIVVRVRIGERIVESRVTVARSAVVLDKVTITRGPNGIDFVADGFDNTRSVSDLRFVFFDVAGARIGTEPIAAAVGDQFARFFRDSPAGGLFRLGTRIPIVAGDPTGVAAVELEIRSAAGAAGTGRVRF
jgi:hypothetical protein